MEQKKPVILTPKVESNDTTPKTSSEKRFEDFCLNPREFVFAPDEHALQTIWMSEVIYLFED